MKNLSAIEIFCVFGGNSMESQNCLQAEPWGFQQSGSGAYDQVKKAAERPWDPPLEERFPAKFDIVLGIVGGFFQSAKDLQIKLSNMKTVTKIFLTLIDWIVVVLTQIPMVSLYQKLTKKR